MTSRRIEAAAAICAAVFIVVLALSAYWDRSIRVLHVFEAIPYLLAVVLCLRRRTSGYALGFVSGAFWVWTAGFLTTFVRNGFERLAILVRTGSLDRPDILIAVPAALATGGLALFSALGYARLGGKRRRDVLVLGAALVAVPAYFIAIFAAFAPRYLGIYRRLLG